MSRVKEALADILDTMQEHGRKAGIAAGEWYEIPNAEAAYYTLCGIEAVDPLVVDTFPGWNHEDPDGEIWELAKQATPDGLDIGDADDPYSFIATEIFTAYGLGFSTGVEEKIAEQCVNVLG